MDQSPPDSHCASLSQVAPLDTAGASLSESSLSDDSEASESSSSSSSSSSEADSDEDDVDSSGSGSGSGSGSDSDSDSGSLVPRKTTLSVGLVVTSRSISVFSTSLPFSVVTSYVTETVPFSPSVSVLVLPFSSESSSSYVVSNSTVSSSVTSLLSTTVTVTEVSSLMVWSGFGETLSSSPTDTPALSRTS